MVIGQIIMVLNLIKVGIEQVHMDNNLTKALTGGTKVQIGGTKAQTGGTKVQIGVIQVQAGVFNLVRNQIIWGTQISTGHSIIGLATHKIITIIGLGSPLEANR